ncbi:hypothetical protein [Larkinella terrae]|uniref:EpsG family protein n=1 Tax=Larkinella terrae TaxID=2025311 RepID=A0A7K0ET64_9BACT|nr:hypothetical protein [Larkinella terrae]MRS64959.1 hypothetical protein [Larkinella terrae]
MTLPAGKLTPLIALFFIFFAFAFCFRVIWFPITHDQLGYTVAETMLNYQNGFYRRALVGNLFGPIHNRFFLQLAIAGTYSLCLICPLLIIRSFKSGWVPILFWIAFFCPFGTALCLKDVLAVRKELFFFLLFYLVTLYNVKSLFGNVLLIVIGSLIHESFFFLFLPFLVCYHWLNHGKIWHMLTLLATGITVTILLSVTPGMPGEVTDLLIDRLVHMGFQKDQFDGFEYFQKLSFSQNLTNANANLSGLNPVVYLFLYVGTFGVLYGLSSLSGLRIKFKKPGGLILSLGIILVMAGALSVIAMDYGRWLSMGFITSVILLSSQIDSFQSTWPRFSATRILILIPAILLLLVIRIPHFSGTTFQWSDWYVVDKAFLASGLFFSSVIAMNPGVGKGSQPGLFAKLQSFFHVKNKARRNFD